MKLSILASSASEKIYQLPDFAKGWNVADKVIGFFFIFLNRLGVLWFLFLRFLIHGDIGDSVFSTSQVSGTFTEVSV